MSHRYYSPLRPLSLGTFPKPQGNEILHIENFEERQNVQPFAAVVPRLYEMPEK